MAGPVIAGSSPFTICLYVGDMESFINPKISEVEASNDRPVAVLLSSLYLSSGLPCDAERMLAMPFLKTASLLVPGS